MRQAIHVLADGRALVLSHARDGAGVQLAAGDEVLWTAPHLLALDRPHRVALPDGGVLEVQRDDFERLQLRLDGQELPCSASHPDARLRQAVAGCFGAAAVCAALAALEAGGVWSAATERPDGVLELLGLSVDPHPPPAWVGAVGLLAAGLGLRARLFGVWAGLVLALGADLVWLHLLPWVSTRWLLVDQLLRLGLIHQVWPAWRALRGDPPSTS